jgi:hypothetical protein
MGTYMQWDTYIYEQCDFGLLEKWDRPVQFMALNVENDGNPFDLAGSPIFRHTH